MGKLIEDPLGPGVENCNQAPQATLASPGHGLSQATCPPQVLWPGLFLRGLPDSSLTFHPGGRRGEWGQIRHSFQLNLNSRETTHRYFGVSMSPDCRVICQVWQLWGGREWGSEPPAGPAPRLGLCPGCPRGLSQLRGGWGMAGFPWA